MEQISLRFSEPLHESVYNTIVKMIADGGVHSEILSLEKLTTSGEYNVKVLKKSMCKICVKAKSKFLQMRYKFLSIVKDSNVDYSLTNSTPPMIRIGFETQSDIVAMKSLILQAFEMAYVENTEETFGCCNSFIKCSDARRCTHPNHLFALGCMYRKNLEAGRIFYGANPTV